MATCILNDGYDLGCFGTGGVSEVYISTFTGSAIVGYDVNEVVSSYESGSTFYKFEQDIEAASFNESINTSRENGSTFYESTVSLKMYNNDATVRNLVKALGKAPVSILIKDNGGEYWLMGTETAARISEGSRGFGQAFGDMNGATMTFSYKSASPVPNVSGSLVGTSIVLG